MGQSRGFQGGGVEAGQGGAGDERGGELFGVGGAGAGHFDLGGAADGLDALDVGAFLAPVAHMPLMGDAVTAVGAPVPGGERVRAGRGERPQQQRQGQAVGTEV